MQEILVSVLTPCYNSIKTIEKTLECIEKQTYQNIEYIIVDGGSTDGTLELIEKHRSRLPKQFTLISEKDNGIYDAMNKGIKMSSGDVIGILNSDDFYTDEDVLQTVADNFRNYSVDAIYGDIHFVREGDLDKCVRYYSSK